MADGKSDDVMHEQGPISIEEARALYRDGGPAHDFDHVLRVLALAERIGRAEGADMAILRTACLLHDVARGRRDAAGEGHGLAGARLAREVLAGCPPAFVDAVAHAIAAHRFRGAVQPETLEAKVLSDADKLDAIGATGVARAYAVAGERGTRLWAAVQADYSIADDVPGREHTPVHEYVFKLAQLKDRLYTRSGRAIAAGRHAFMVQFFEQLAREVRGEA